MDEDRNLGIGLANAAHFLRRDLLVHVAEALPRDDVLLRHLLRDVVGEVAIGNEQNVLVRQRSDHFRRIGRRADDVGERLDRCGGVDVADHREIGILLFQFLDAGLQVFGRRGVRELTSRQKIWKQNGARPIDDLRRLGHEVHTAEFDDVGIFDVGRHQRQLE